MAIVLVPKDSLPVSRIWRGNVYVPDDEGTEELPQDLLEELGQPKAETEQLTKESTMHVERFKLSPAAISALDEHIAELEEKETTSVPKQKAKK